MYARVMRKSFLAPCSSHSLTTSVAGLPRKGPRDKPGYSNAVFLPTEAKAALKKGILNFGKLLAHHDTPSATEPNSGGRGTRKSLSRLVPTATALPCLGGRRKAGGLLWQGFRLRVEICRLKRWWMWSRRRLKGPPWDAVPTCSLLLKSMLWYCL